MEAEAAIGISSFSNPDLQRYLEFLRFQRRRLSAKSVAMSMAEMKKQIPEDLIVEILSRLPVKSLVRFKCVSKKWRGIISDPQFAKSQFKLASEQHTLSQKLLRFGSTHCETVDLETPSFEDKNSAVRNLSLALRQSDQPSLALLGSCNGLVFCGGMDAGVAFIWNPSTSFLRQLPPLPHPRPRGFAASASGIFPSRNHPFGFGYVSASHDYKVVIMADNGRDDYLPCPYVIFSSRTNSWKLLDAPVVLSNQRSAGALFGEALHWMSANPTAKVVVAFDLAKEEFRQVSLPSPDFDFHFTSEQVGVLGGCLCVTCEYAWTIEFWVMREYGVPESWTKPFILNMNDLGLRWDVPRNPHTYVTFVFHPSGRGVAANLANPDICWKLYSNSTFVSLDDGVDKVVVFSGISIIAYDESLLSL